MNTALSKSGLFLLTACSLLIVKLALADATMIYEQSNGSHKSENIMQIKDNKIRFTPPEKQNDYSLFDSQKNELIHIDVEKKQYLRMNEQFIEQQAQQAKQRMDTMRQRMQEKMKDMPDEQKKQVEQMMNNHLSRVEAAKNPAKLEQKKTTRSENIAGVQCTIYEFYLKGKIHSELCITTSENMGLSANDSKALMAMQTFMKRMQKVAQSIAGSPVIAADIQGIPLHSLLFGPDASVKMETRLKSLNTKALDSQIVLIPDGYVPMTIPDR